MAAQVEDGGEEAAVMNTFWKVFSSSFWFHDYLESFSKPIWLNRHLKNEKKKKKE